MHPEAKCAVDGMEEDAQISWKRLILTAALVAIILVAIGGSVAGKNGVEKTATRLSLPIGLGWLLLSAYCIQRSLVAGLRRATVSWSIWFAFMFATTSPFASWCVQRLESSVEAYRPERDGQLAVVVVLGGGTHQGPWRAELSTAGDRVMYAAQLYLQNHTKRLITTGDAIPGLSSHTTSPREHTIELWTQLGIPDDAIGTLQGQNTYQEIQSLKQVYGQLESRVGILTSAMHLPRAMRLAKAEGLDVVGLAADHVSSNRPFTFLDFIPSAGPLNQLAACQYEFMAWFVRR